MTTKICTATVKMNTSEVLKAINALTVFTNNAQEEGNLENEDYKGYEKLLSDFHTMYTAMTDMENEGVRE